ncbi:unnamed protein product [Closterium sp. NIES-65]|nr:unnamed protein product [Closterium sp. NIES-65]
MLGSALQHPVETDGGDAGGEEQDSYWPSSPHREWQGGGQTRDETGDDNEYRPTVAEVEAAAAEDSAAGAGGDANVEEEVQEQEEEGAGRNAREHGGDNGRGGRGRGGRGGGRVGRGQGRSSARAQAVGNAGGRSGGYASGPPVDGRGGGRVGRVAHSAARAGRGGSGGGRAAEAAPDPGPGNAPTQRSDGVGSTPLHARGISRGGGTAGSRGPKGPRVSNERGHPLERRWVYPWEEENERLAVYAEQEEIWLPGEREELAVEKKREDFDWLEEAIERQRRRERDEREFGYSDFALMAATKEPAPEEAGSEQPGSSTEARGGRICRKERSRAASTKRGTARVGDRGGSVGS